MHRIKVCENLFNDLDIAAILQNAAPMMSARKRVMPELRYRLDCIKSDGTKVKGILPFIKRSTLEPLQKSLSAAFPDRIYKIVTLELTEKERILELVK